MVGCLLRFVFQLKEYGGSMITLAVASKICNLSEFSIVESTFDKELKNLSASKSQKKLEACRRHLKKWKSRETEQAKEINKKAHEGKKITLDPINKTRRKITVFSEAIERLTEHIKNIE